MKNKLNGPVETWMAISPLIFLMAMYLIWIGLLKF